MKPTEERQEIDSNVAAGNAALAARKLHELWAREKDPSCAAFVVSRFEQLRPHIELLLYRIAILRSFTVEPIVPLLRAAAFVAGIDLAVHVSDFNAYAQEMLDPASSLYRFNPDAVILAVQTRDVAPDLWRDFADLEETQVQAAIDRTTSALRDWTQAFHKNCRAHLILHNLEQPESPSLGALDSQREASQKLALDQINRNLRKIAEDAAGMHILDYDALVARHGRAAWHDERRWLTFRLPISGAKLIHLAEEWMRFLHPLTGKIAKCLAVDLDNTLWGGVIGEDGIAGIRLGTEYPGAAYQDLQRVLLDLHRRGILLAICSKNNRDEALDALKNHPAMLLRAEHFSSIRINWLEKSQNLREIAAELNIGIDSMAFLDDNPIEREHVRTTLPEVSIIELPGDAAMFARTVRECPLFERLTLSAEDRQRGDLYQAQQERTQFQKQTVTREDFYRSLQQQVEIAPVTNAMLPRVAQLINKTNQFNLTTQRYSEQQIAELIAQPEWNCFSMRVRDRFGDNGLTAVAITRCQDDICEIDTFLMSCRVIGRTLETALLTFLADYFHRRGMRKLVGWFRPTKKNAPAGDFYSNHGFASIQSDGDSILWSLDISDRTLSCPEWISVHFAGEGLKDGDLKE